MIMDLTKDSSNNNDEKFRGGGVYDWESISESGIVEPTPTADLDSYTNNNSYNNWKTVGKSNNKDSYNINYLRLDDDEIKECRFFIEV